MASRPWLFASDFAARPGEIIGAAGGWRERLALDQRPRGERIDRGWARAGAAEQLIGADRGCHQRHDRPDRSQNPPASRSSPQAFAEAQKVALATSAASLFLISWIGLALLGF